MVTNPADTTTERRILQAAEHELLGSDPGSLRVDRVARAAEVNKRMIYHYFNDREGLLGTVYAVAIYRLQMSSAAISETTRQVLGAIVGEVVWPIDAREPEDFLSGTSPSALELQQSARILLPYLLLHADSNPHKTISIEAWIGFCVEFMSLAMTAPTLTPLRAGTETFVELVESRFRIKKSRVRIQSVSRLSSN